MSGTTAGRPTESVSKKRKHLKLCAVGVVVTAVLIVAGACSAMELRYANEWNTVGTSTAPVCNPALICLLQKPTFTTAFNTALPYDFYGLEHTIQVPVGLFSGTYLSYLDMIPLKGSRGVYPYELYRVLNAGCAFDLGGLFLTGLGGRVVYDKSDGRLHRQEALDFGILGRLVNDEVWGKHFFGLCMQNALAIGSKNSALPLPSSLDATWYWKSTEGLVEGTTDLIVDNLHFRKAYRDNAAKVRLDWASDLTINYQKFFLAFGAGSRFWRFGGGVELPAAKNDLTAAFDLVHFRDDTRSTGCSARLQYAFGLPRESVYARRMGVVTVCDFSYELALRMDQLFQRGNYYDCLGIGMRIMDEHPKFSKIYYVVRTNILAARRLYMPDMIAFLVGASDTLIDTADQADFYRGLITETDDRFPVPVSGLPASVRQRLQNDTVGQQLLVNGLLLEGKYAEALLLIDSCTPAYRGRPDMLFAASAARFLNAGEKGANQIGKEQVYAADSTGTSEYATGCAVICCNELLQESASPLDSAWQSFCERVSPVSGWYFDVLAILQEQYLRLGQYEKCMEASALISAGSQDAEMRLYAVYRSIKATCRVDERLPEDMTAGAFKRKIEQKKVELERFQSATDSVTQELVRINRMIEAGLEECLFARQSEATTRRIDTLISEHRKIHPLLPAVYPSFMDVLHKRLNLYKLERLQRLVENDGECIRCTRE